MSMVIDPYRFAVAGWTPADVTTHAWYDVSDVATITFGSGSLVSQLADKSGNGYHLSQATGAAQPSRTGSQNGLSTLLFDGTDDILIGSTAGNWTKLHNGTTYIVGMVWRTTLADPNALGMIVGTSTNFSTSTIGFWICHDDRSGSSRDDRILYYVATGSGVAIDGLMGADNSFPGGVFDSLTALINPDASPSSDRGYIYRDTTLISSAETSTTAPSAASPSNPLRVGFGETANYKIAWELAELVFITDADATDANRQLLNSYYVAKWGV